jgi:hypothetical protein
MHIEWYFYLILRQKDIGFTNQLGLTCETCRDNFTKKNWKAQFPINSILKDKIGEKQHSIKKIQVNLSQPTKLPTQVIHV